MSHAPRLTRIIESREVRHLDKSHARLDAFTENTERDERAAGDAPILEARREKLGELPLLDRWREDLCTIRATTR